MSVELKPCPFCGGTGNLSFKDYAFGGQNYLGDKKIKYRVQIICNKCKSRGKPVVTHFMKNPNPYISQFWSKKYEYSGGYSSAETRRQDNLFAPYVEMAIEAWNRRVER